MTLHRRIIRSLSSVDDSSLRSICRQAAQVRLKSAMDFVSSLRPEHLQSFWYSASKYNFALIGTFISLLWVTAIDESEASKYKKSLEDYQWVLRLSSKSAEFLERAISMLAASTGVLVKAISEQPDADRILNRHLLRTRRGSATVAGHARHAHSVSYQSESEMHNDTSPENIIGGTPSDSGAMSRAWNVDQAWFSTPDEGGGDFQDILRGASGSDPYSLLGEAQVGFDYLLRENTL
jgi:hypothetical protein